MVESRTPSPKTRRPRRRRSWMESLLERAGMGAQNALDLVRLGRLASPYGAPYEVLHEERVYRLRRYAAPEPAPADRPVLLLVPPLMVTSEIYDISPEHSAVSQLTAAGIDTFVCDFGAPEQEEGGMERTLDDHVRAVDDAIERVRTLTGRDVHLGGYSQGGMFCYQAAAYRRSEGLASVITFGSPVDIHRSLPGVADHLAARFIGVASRFVEHPLERMEGLPGVLTSTGFKVLSFRKELQQLADFVKKLHDRTALVRRERSRRFLAGEGFVAWPGPALRKFVDEFIVHNRLMQGGFVIDGRTVTLADITCPVLYFVGGRDDIARPAAVRAIQRAAPRADLYEVEIKAGHFGLVVGSRSLAETWPTVAEWMRWKEQQGPVPGLLHQPEPAPAPEDGFDAELGEVGFDLFYDVIVDGVRELWDGLEGRAREAERAVDALRWQLPRLRRLQRIRPDTRISAGQVLAQRAAEMPESTFFLWEGRAFSYGQADRRIDNVVRGLVHCGVEPGQRVGVLMGRRPSYLTMVGALSRLGAVGVLFGSERVDLAHGIEHGGVEIFVTDPEHAAAARDAFDGPVLVLGGGGPKRALVPGVIDMEAIDPKAVELPKGFTPNPGRASDLALILFTAGKGGQPRPARITNRRWAVSALGAAAACTLSPKDTVYCVLPLHHAAGMLVAVGGALVGGARLALARDLEPDVFWDEVRRYGASVVFYANEMCRRLTHAPVRAEESRNPVRLFAGSGMRADVWQRILDRFGSAGVVEFYATTEGSAVLANASGEKVGSIGRPLPGSNDIRVVRYDFDRDDVARDAEGRCIPCQPGERGLLVAQASPEHPGFEEDDPGRWVHGVLETGDRWIMSGDVACMDADGDFWFIDRLRDMIRTRAGPVASRRIEDALYGVPGVALAAAYGVRPEGDDDEVPVATVLVRKGMEIDREAFAEAVRALPEEARPRWVRFPERMDMTDGYRPLKSPLRELGIRAEDGVAAWRWDEATGTYVTAGSTTDQRAS